MTTWIVTMQVVAPESTDAPAIEKLIEHALDDDDVLCGVLDVTNVRAEAV